jgi:hypothetical protein
VTPSLTCPRNQPEDVETAGSSSPPPHPKRDVAATAALERRKPRRVVAGPLMSTPRSRFMVTFLVMRR